MQISQKGPSMIVRSVDWIANHTYRKIPSIIYSYKKKPITLKKLSFQDYIKQPQVAREEGLKNVREKRKDYIEQKQEIERVISQFKSSTELMKQNPHELICAICFQLFSGPVTTSCNHTFCRMCIDQSILFNPNCPTCRNNIRGQELIVSKATEAIIRMILYKLQIDEVERFVKKQFQYQEWLEKRTPKREELHKGQLIDVRDTENIWCKGSIIEVLPLNASDPSKYEYLLVHYEGWASRFDEVISLESMRLATSRFYLSRYEIPHYNLDPNNPEHYRCPVVIGPPQPVAAIVEEPMMSDSDSDSESSDDNQIVFIDQDEEVIQNQSFIEENQDSSLSEQNSIIRSNSDSEQEHDGMLNLNDLDEMQVLRDRLDGIHHSQIQQNYDQNQALFINRETNDNQSMNHDFQNGILWQQRHNNTQQGIQLQRDLSVEHSQHQYHSHSLPQERILGDLIKSDFGQMIDADWNLQNGNQWQINSQVDERIFREVNQQMQQIKSPSSDQLVSICGQLFSSTAPQNPQQKSLEKVQLQNRMNGKEFQIKQNQQLVQRQNENEEKNDIRSA